MPARVPGRQQRVDPLPSGMSEIEAVKLISNVKFEDVAALSTLLGPDTVQIWSRDFGAFLVQNSAIAIVVHNNEEEQSEIWFGEVLDQGLAHRWKEFSRPSSWVWRRLMNAREQRFRTRATAQMPG